jgi:hypothetical protein
MASRNDNIPLRCPLLVACAIATATEHGGEFHFSTCNLKNRWQ